LLPALGICRERLHIDDSGALPGSVSPIARALRFASSPRWPGSTARRSPRSSTRGARLAS